MSTYMRRGSGGAMLFPDSMVPALQALGFVALTARLQAPPNTTSLSVGQNTYPVSNDGTVFADPADVNLLTAAGCSVATTASSSSSMTFTPATVAGGAAAGAPAGSLSCTLSGTVSYSVLSGALAVNATTGVLTTTGTAPTSGGIAAEVLADNGTDVVGKHITVPILAAGVTVPAAPTITSVTAGNGQLTIAFTDGSNGGAAITAHGLYMSTTSMAEQYVGDIMSGSPYAITGLSNGQIEYIRLTAKNTAGEGPKSAEASGIPQAAPTIASAAVRARMPFVSSGGSQVVVGNAITQSRVREKTNVALSGVWAEFANSYVDGNVTNAGQEVGPGSPVTIRASLLTGLSGSGQSLTASTITPLTFNNAGVAAAGYAYNLDGSACTLSQISARGSVSSDGQTITLPSGCYVRCDTTSINLNAGDAYVIQIEEVKTAQQTATAASASGTTATFSIPDTSKYAVGDTFVAGTAFVPAGYAGRWIVTAVRSGQIDCTVTTSGLANATTLGTISVNRVVHVGGRPDLGDAIKLAANATFIGSASGATLTLTTPLVGAIAIGMTVQGVAITAQASGTLNAAGSTYTLASALTIAAGTTITTGGSGLLVQSANWSAVATMITGTQTAAPVAVFGTSATGVKVVDNDGDSINTEVGDWATGTFNGVAFTNSVFGDADGAVAFGNRALNAAGYSSVRTAIPGTKASQVTSYGGDNHRALIRRYASATLTNHLHNDEGVQASGAAMITVMQAYNNHLRAGMLSGSAKRVVNMSGTPATTSSSVALASLTYSGTTATATTTAAHNLSTGAYVVIAGATPSGFNTGVAGVPITVTSSTTFTYTVASGLASPTGTITYNDLFETDQNQVSANPSTAYGYPSGWQYTVWAPYVNRTGPYAGVAFNTSNGDPDAGYDNTTPIRSPITGLWPSDGLTPHKGTVDGTHPSALIHAQIAADLQTKAARPGGFLAGGGAYSDPAAASLTPFAPAATTPHVPPAVAALLQPTAAFEQLGGSQLALYDWSGASGAVGGFMPGMAQSGNKLESYLFIGGDASKPAARCIGANGEQQIYGDPEYGGLGNPFGFDPVAGTFTITCTPMPAGASTTYTDSKPFLSGSLATRQVYWATYGLWEIRCANPATLGTWFALWLLPKNITTANKGQTTEVDISEQYGARVVASGLDIGKSRDFGTLHGLDANGNAIALPVFRNDDVHLDGQMHTYGVLITPSTIQFYLDGVPVGLPTPNAAPYAVNDDHYLVMSLATGGSDWLGVNGTDPPISNLTVSPTPTTVSFEYARHFPMAS